MELEFIHSEEIENVIKSKDRHNNSIRRRIEVFSITTKKERIDFEEKKQNLIKTILYCLYLKFIVVNREDDKVLKIFDSLHGHYSQLAPDVPSSFIGAGKLFLGRVYWESDSFKEELGWDRPANIQQATQILKEVREKMEVWIGNMIEFSLAKQALEKQYV